MAIATLGFLKKLLDTPGPSGFEQAPARVWRDEVAAFADSVEADVHGNSVAVLKPKGKPRLMLAGHIDEIGLQITHIDDDGFLYFSGIGGWDSQVLVGQRVLLLSREGSVRGVIGKKAVHKSKGSWEGCQRSRHVDRHRRGNKGKARGCARRPGGWSRWTNTRTGGLFRAASTTASGPTSSPKRSAASRPGAPSMRRYSP